MHVKLNERIYTYLNTMLHLLTPSIIHCLRGLDGRGHFLAILTSTKQRALYNDIGECSNFLS